MKTVSFVLGGLAVLGAIVGTLQWVRLTSAAEPHRHAGTEDKPELVRSGDNAMPDSSAEIQRLRMELRLKDAQLRMLAAVPKAPDRTPDPVVADPHAPEASPEARAADLLDERMLMAPADPRKAAAMEHALRELAAPAVLGESKLTALECGSTLCKMTISAGTPAAINQAVMAMSSRLPKGLFGASTVLQVGDGQSAMYVAKSSEELTVDPTADGKH